jgi:hypothetical protein
MFPALSLVQSRGIGLALSEMLKGRAFMKSFCNFLRAIERGS